MCCSVEYWRTLHNTAGSVCYLPGMDSFFAAGLSERERRGYFHHTQKKYEEERAIIGTLSIWNRMCINPNFKTITPPSIFTLQTNSVRYTSSESIWAWSLTCWPLANLVTVQDLCTRLGCVGRKWPANVHRLRWRCCLKGAKFLHICKGANWPLSVHRHGTRGKAWFTLRRLLHLLRQGS